MSSSLFEPVVIGIDPGLRGAVAVLGVNDRKFTASFTMPIAKVGKRNQIDLSVIIRLFTTFRSTFDIQLLAIEHPQTFPGEGAVGAFSYGQGFGMILGVLRTLAVPYSTIKPQAWKADSLSGTQRDKAAAVSFVSSLFPNVNLCPGRSVKPHDGIADAFCIAEHARRLVSGRSS